MKILALYLPAFHQVKINDDTWGEGFTEWNNVKAAEPLYKGHYQPIEPLDDKYYDLSKKEDIEYQISLANKYGVNGFIFYHYWFGNGVQALEKPAEILRDEINSQIEYCFCWANHSWYTTWHGKTSEIIVQQEYGSVEEWKKHIYYLMEFFKDPRYIKFGNRPVLYIYNMSDIKNKNMFDVWNEELNKNGFGNIYIVEYIFSRNRKVSYQNTDGVMEFEPMYTTVFDISKFKLFKRFICKKLKRLDFQDYDYLWKKIVTRNRTYDGKKIFKSCFVNWDNSARKNRDSMIVRNFSPEKFGYYLKQLIASERKDSSNDMIIINAWNEWSEGAMLEPTKRDGMKYLEEIKNIVDDYT